MAVRVLDDTIPTYDTYPLDVSAIVRLLIVGAVTGVIGWLLYLGIAHFFISPVFCSNADTFTVCQNGGAIAWAAAHIIVLAAAVALLARLAVYRPLLVILGVLVSLWGAYAWLGSFSWWAGALWQGLLFALAFGVFGWIARTTSFVVALVLTIVVALLARLVLLAA